MFDVFPEDDATNNRIFEVLARLSGSQVESEPCTVPSGGIGAAPRAEGRRRLFYSGTHGSTCPNCEQFVAGERYHIPDVMGYTGPSGKCMERRPDEPVLPPTCSKCDAILTETDDPGPIEVIERWEGDGRVR